MSLNAQVRERDNEVLFLLPDGRYRSRWDSGPLNNTLHHVLRKVSHKQDAPDWRFSVPTHWRGREAERRVLALTAPNGATTVLDFGYFGHTVPESLEEELGAHLTKEAPHAQEDDAAALVPAQRDPGGEVSG